MKDPLAQLLSEIRGCTEREEHNDDPPLPLVALRRQQIHLPRQSTTILELLCDQQLNHGSAHRFAHVHIGLSIAVVVTARASTLR